MTWWHDFPKDKGGGNVNLKPVWEQLCIMRRSHQNCQLPSSLSSLPNHLFYQKVVEVVIAWKGKSMGKFELVREHGARMSCFSCMDKETPELYAIFGPTHSHFLFSLMF